MLAMISDDLRRPRDESSGSSSTNPGGVFDESLKWSVSQNLVKLYAKYGEAKTLKLYGPFLWIGFNLFKATESLRGGSLLYTIKFPEIPGTRLVDLGRMKGWVDLGATQ